MPSRRNLIAGAASVLGLARFGRSQAAQDPNADPLSQIERSGKITQHFGKAKDAEIDRYEALYKTRFSQGYRAFLKRENGLGYFYSLDQPVKTGPAGALADMNTFFGIGNGDPNNDLMLVTPTMSYWSVRLLPLFPLLGLGGDFCTFTEINGGSKYAGHIMYTDGEVYFGFRDTPLDKPIDDLVDGFIKDGWFADVAPSFDALLAEYAKMV